MFTYTNVSTCVVRCMLCAWSIFVRFAACAFCRVCSYLCARERTRAHESARERAGARVYVVCYNAAKSGA